ncbi:MAG TPA: hypothetical protein VF723_17505 [Pyrinomonadaceae bacterium]|jgi:heme/copper-type cytochrome/quinol oxidase subunit 2
MMLKRAMKILMATTGLLLMLLGAVLPAEAQCAMCKASLAGASNATTFASGLNLAIIVLLIPPVLIFCAIFIVAYRYRQPGHTASPRSALENR